ncbi:MAG: protein kinase [Polyangiaceae bacterium]
MSTHKLAPGTVLGRYELLLPIAQGGMATVWAARQKGSRGFSKTVAVKTMLPNLSEDAAFEQMFLDEAAIASKIHHPNVAEILDLGEQDEILYLVMEWVDGESLSALSKQTKKLETEIPLRIALKIVAQACAGLHAAHELRDENDTLVELVHRDVSPQNILVASSGLVKLVDFGVAKALGRSGATSVGQLKGKVPYMSPEQTRGQDLDRRTDTFAMGSVLYRVVTGIHPFIDDNDIKTMRNIATRPTIRPRVKNPKLPVELEAVIMKALEKTPAKRFQTAAELEHEIDKVLSLLGGPVATEEVGAFVRGTLAERDQKRRAALRDAVRVADEAAAGGPASRDSARIINRNSVETVSDLMLTKSATPPSFTSGVVPDGATSSDPPPSRNPTLAGLAEQIRAGARQAPADDEEATRAVVLSEAILAPPSAPAPSVAPPLPGRIGSETDPPRDVVSSPTLAAVTGTAMPLVVAQKRRTGVIAAAALLVVGAGAVAALLVAKSSAKSPDGRPATTVASVASATPKAVTPAAPEETAKPKSSGISIDDLPSDPAASSSATPDATPTAPGGNISPHLPAGIPGPHVATTPSNPTPKPAEPPPTAKPADPATQPTTKPWVPAVQNPGF